VQWYDLVRVCDSGELEGAGALSCGKQEGRAWWLGGAVGLGHGKPGVGARGEEMHSQGDLRWERRLGLGWCE